MKSLRPIFSRFGALLLLAVIMSAPLLTHAQTAPKTFTDFINIFIDLLETLLPILATLAVLAFFWGLVKFIANAGDVKSHEDGRTLMVWGTVGIFVIVAIWGILAFLSNELGFGAGAAIPLLPENGNISTTNTGQF